MVFSQLSFRLPSWPVYVCALLLLGATAQAKERVHTVYEGQRLGSIAKRYNVTVEELCRANGIKQTAPIRPGQKLIIPDKNSKAKPATATEKSGTDTTPASGTKAATTKPSANSATQSTTKSKSASQEAQVHIVARGHTLSAIASRYRVSVAAICRASGIQEKTPLKLGQRLIIPAPSDRDGSAARKQRLSGVFEQESKDSSSKDGNESWKKYEKKPQKRGYVTLNTYNRSFKGFVIGPSGKVLPQANAKINDLLGASSKGPAIDARLIQLLAQVSDRFGGRPLRIVSGYRTKSFVADSKHKEGRALDFSIIGVPNEALRDYLRTQRHVGVGYYPNSSFVHLDVRNYNAYWVDYAGPGEAPRKHPNRSAVASNGKSSSKKSSASSAKAREEEIPEHDEPPDDAAVDPRSAPPVTKTPAEPQAAPAEVTEEAPPPPPPLPSEE